MQINLNEYAVVVLTEFGADIWNGRYAGLDLMPGYVLEQVAAGDTLKEQLWILMQVFGPGMMIGMPQVPFASNNFSMPVVGQALDEHQRVINLYRGREETARKMIADRDAQIAQLKACLALAEARINRTLLAQDRAVADERRMVSQPHTPERRAGMALESPHVHHWMIDMVRGDRMTCRDCGEIVIDA